MPLHRHPIGNVLLAAAGAVVLTFGANAGYGLVFLPWQGMPAARAAGELAAGARYLVLGLFLAAVSAVLGARLTAGCDARARWAGLAAGAGLALVVVAAARLRGRLDFWLPPNALMAVVGSLLGGWLAGRAPAGTRG